MPFNSQTAKSAGAESSRKGVPNKIGEHLRQKIINFLDDNLDLMLQDFEKLQPKERIQLALKFLEYTTPKLKSIDGSSFKSIDEQKAKEIELMEWHKKREKFIKKKLSEAKENARLRELE